MRMKTSKLVGMALAGLVFTTPIDLARAENPELESNNKKPYEQIQGYLDSRGVAREEFRESHYFFYDNGGTIHYNRSYIFGKELFTEQYDLLNIVRPGKNGNSLMLFAYPSAFYLRGIWYLDPFKDGFNGNEIAGEGKAVNEPEPKLEDEVKCNPRKSGFCV